MVEKCKITTQNKAKGDKRTSIVKLNRKPLFLTRPLVTLSTTFISRDDLNRVFGLPKDSDSMSRFIELNRENLRFLDIELKQIYEVERKGIIITTGRYAGAVPIKSPRTSLYTVDLSVRGSYSADMDDDELYSLLSEMGVELLPEFSDSLQLTGDSIKPPLYFECENFLQLYNKALSINWTNFTNEIQVEDAPRGATDWSSYALKSYDPRYALKFENHINSQTVDHNEWRQINYVLERSIRIIGSSSTPRKAKIRNQKLINRLRQHPASNISVRTRHIPEHTADPQIIKQLKSIANMILTDSTDHRRSWRIDIAKLYEIYVQYILRKAAPGWRWAANPHYAITGSRPSWGLRYLEPDLVLLKGDHQIVVDAKYKSNMLNRADVEAQALKESFRRDLHQVIAYSSFDSSVEKSVMMIFPCAENFDNIDESIIRIRRQRICSPYSQVSVLIHIIGVPFRGNCLKDVIASLRSFFLDRIEPEDRDE